MITVYSKPHCPYCDKAKYLLKSLDLQGPTPVSKASCWGNITSSKVLSSDGIEEANKKTKERKAVEEAKKKQKKVYDEHVESDYDGNDFFSDDESLNDDEYYNDDEYDGQDL